MKTDTPETDTARAEYQKAMWTGKVLPSQEMVPITFARKLERERDEARKVAEEWREHADKWTEKEYALPWESLENAR